MPCLIRQLTPNGLHAVDTNCDTLVDAARYEPQDGVYTITNTYNTFEVLKPDAHFDRMEDSARRESIPIWLDRARVRAALREMIAEAGWGDVRFRITAAKSLPDSLLLSIEPFAPPPREVYERGVRCITVENIRRHNPAAKTTDWLVDRQSIEHALPPGMYTGLLVSETGDLLEGLSSNFYAIMDDTLRTAGDGVLPGIAMQIVLDVAPAILPVRREPVRVTDIPRLQEAFLTSASRGIMPLVEIDGIRIGDGMPGRMTNALREAYAEWVAQHLEDL